MKKYYIFIFMLLMGCMMKNVYAEDLYTCSSNNIKQSFCKLINDSTKEKYGCTITDNSNGCGGTCTKLKKEDIEKYGSLLNISLSDCTVTQSAPMPTDKGGDTGAPGTEPTTGTPTDKGGNTGSPTPSSPTPSSPTGSTPGSGETDNNPQTGALMAIVVWAVGMFSFIFMCFIFFKNNNSKVIGG